MDEYPKEFCDTNICKVKVALPNKDQITSGEVQFTNEEIRILEQPDISMNSDMNDDDYWYIVDIQGDISNAVDYDFVNFDGNEPLLIDDKKSELLKYCIEKAYPDRVFDVSKKFQN